MSREHKKARDEKIILYTNLAKGFRFDVSDSSSCSRNHWLDRCQLYLNLFFTEIIQDSSRVRFIYRLLASPP